MANQISCDAHDYFEIVCMRRSLIKVTTYKNQQYQGIAINIKLFEKQEFLHIANSINTKNILLSEVKKLEALGNSVDKHNFLITW